MKRICGNKAGSLPTQASVASCHAITAESSKLPWDFSRIRSAKTFSSCPRLARCCTCSALAVRLAGILPGGLDQPRTRRFRMALADQLVVKAGVDFRSLVDELPYVPAPHTRAFTATDSEAYKRTLNKLKPGRLTGPNLVDVWPVWREHCEMRVKDPKHKMPQKWN